MKVTMDTERRIVLVTHCDAWLELSPLAAQNLAHDLVDRTHELLRYYERERTAIPKLSASQVNDLLSDAGRPKKGNSYHARRQLEEKLSQERYEGLHPTSVPSMFKKEDAELEELEGIAPERDLKGFKDCEVKAMLKYFPPKDDLMTPFDE